MHDRQEIITICTSLMLATKPMTHEKMLTTSASFLTALDKVSPRPSASKAAKVSK
jgi:hypothetical protein